MTPHLQSHARITDSALAAQPGLCNYTFDKQCLAPDHAAATGSNDIDNTKWNVFCSALDGSIPACCEAAGCKSVRVPTRTGRARGLGSQEFHVTCYPPLTPPLIEAGLKRFFLSMSDRFTRVEVPRFIGRNQACIKDRCNEAF